MGRGSIPHPETVSPAQAVVIAMQALSRRSQGRRLFVLARELARAIQPAALAAAIDLVDEGEEELTAYECYQMMTEVRDEQGR